MELKQKEYNYAIDLLKFVASILIIAIHKQPLESYSSVANFYLVDVICRFGVPFFFATSGYLLFKKMKFKHGKLVKCDDNKNYVIKYLKHIVLLYVLWSLIYLLWQIPYWISIDWTGITAVKNYLITFFLHGSNYHFWFLVSLIIATAILYVLLTNFDTKKVFALSCIFYVIKCLIYSYYWLPIPGIIYIQSFLEKISAVRDAFGIAIPCMMVGVLFSNKQRLMFHKKELIISMILLIIEISFLKFLSPNESTYSYVFMTLPACYFFFSFVCNNVSDK